MSEEGSPAPPAGSGSVPVAELKALLKDSLVEILRENPSLVRPSEDAGSGSRSGKPHVSVFVMARWCLRVGFFFMIRVSPVWERRSGVQAGGGPCLSGDVLSVAYDGVSPSCCPRRGWPGSYAGPNGSGRARAAGC